MENDKRVGMRERRSGARWRMVMVIAIAAASGYILGQPWRTGPSVDEIAQTFHADPIPAIDSLGARIQTLADRPPTERVVIRDRFIRDTIYIPRIDTFYAAAEIVRVMDTTTLVLVDTVYMPPQIIRIPAPERGFWSSDTYKPSIGNFAWATGGGILGYWLRGQVDNSARSCIVINGDETCNF